MRSGCWTNRGGGAGVQLDPDRPVLIDKYLDRADELDVDALCDKDGNVVITGIMQHIEQAPSPTPPRAVSCPPGSTGATARLHCRTPSIEHSVAVRQCRRSPVADFSLLVGAGGGALRRFSMRHPGADHLGRLFAGPLFSWPAGLHTYSWHSLTALAVAHQICRTLFQGTDAQK